MNNKANPMPIVRAIYEHSWSQYPEKVRISMDNGKVVDYRIEMKQPVPVFKDMLDVFNETCFGGYKYKGRR